LERQSKEYLKDIERAKYHEELGKEHCQCSYCEEQKKIRAKVKAERKKQAKSEQKPIMVEGECSNCFQYKKVDSESGLCRKCANS